MAEDDLLLAAGAVLRAGERAPELGRRAEHVEELRRDPRRLELRRLPGLDGDRRDLFRNPAIASSVRLFRCRSRKSPAEWLLCGSSAVAVQTVTIRASSRNGSGRSSTPFTTLKMAVLAAIPSAIVVIAMAENPGVLISVRTAYLKLDIVDPNARIRQIARTRTTQAQRNEREDGRRAAKCADPSRDADHQVAEQRRGQPGAGEAERDAGRVSLRLCMPTS